MICTALLDGYWLANCTESAAPRKCFLRFYLEKAGRTSDISGVLVLKMVFRVLWNDCTYTISASAIYAVSIVYSVCSELLYSV